MNKLFLFLISIIILQSCFKSEQDSEVSIPTYFLKDHIMEQTIPNVRLADGAPIDLQITYRWKVTEVDSFINQFENPLQFDSLILQPRAREIADLQSVKFNNIDSVFTSKREEYINRIRTELLFGLGGNEATIKEVIITSLEFPTKYTRALEDISLKKKEIERIKQQSLVDLAQSEANKKKTKSDGLVQIAQAEAAGRLEKIKASTEKDRRASQLALAETQAQVTELAAKAEAKKREIALQVELKNKSEIKELERTDLIARNEIDLEDQRKKDANSLQTIRKSTEQEMELARQQRVFDFEMEMTFAQLCTDKPLYADYLVSKELASQVEIAILPTGAEMSVFEDVIKNTMTKRQ